MKLDIRHRTDYHYAGPVSQAVNELCLAPRTTPFQRCLNTRLDVMPLPEQVVETTDLYGNTITRFSIDEPHTVSRIIATSTVETDDEPPLLPDSPPLQEVASLLDEAPDEDRLLAFDCLLPSRYVPRSADIDVFAARFASAGTPVLELATRLNRHIFEHFSYDPTFSTVVTPLEAVLHARKGVCQDFAHLALAMMRQLGVPARYVSGYLETLPPPGQAKLRGSDASHAWFSVYVPTHGWYDFDPTNDQRPNGQYVTTAWGRDYGDVAPLRGVVFGGGHHTLAVAVDVDRRPD